MCYVVVDLEMCQVPKANRSEKYKYGKEIIQIGAVLLDDNYDIVDEFNTLVKPEYGVISSKIERLTGIGNHDVSESPYIEEAIENFASWLPDEVTFVAWSENDELQIRKEIQGKGLEFDGKDKLLGDWIDCQVTFGEIINNNRRYKLVEALNLSDIDYDGKIHDGLVDASNTALLFKKMKTEKEFSFNSYYLKSENESERLTCSLGSMFSDLFELKLA